MNDWTAPYRKKFASQLYDNVLPFWLENAVDATHGGYLHQLDRKGQLLSPNKGTWTHGRFLWLLSWLYQTANPEGAYLEAAESGYRFVASHGRDKDGRWWYELTRDGRPLRKRRYLFSEVFITLGLISWAAVVETAESTAAAQLALGDLEHWLGRQQDLPPKYVPENHKVRGHAMTMILINLYQELRRVCSDGEKRADYTRRIENQVGELFRYFVKPQESVLLELVAGDGSIIDTPEGREINPGHAMESAWFLMEESAYQSDPTVQENALRILEDSLRWGWDEEYGGLFSFRDLRDRPSHHIDWDMKYWWPHTEAMYATLLAYSLTGEERWRSWFESVADYTLDRFPDPDGLEWFGYLHRDGSVANTLKGSMWKGPFHIPRALAKCISVIDGMEQG